ncbi:Uncharacterised protein [Streptococcus pneumoniae]|nr:Uncharacterised protein [Streptococcus pneumoniae]CKB66824.1 Uncharacterised protein [Streptococcus pneumoniae]
MLQTEMSLVELTMMLEVCKTKDVHFTNHKQPARHPYGKIGEHAHDFVFDDEGKFVSRSTRELTDDERKENQDILWRY